MWGRKIVTGLRLGGYPMREVMRRWTPWVFLPGRLVRRFPSDKVLRTIWPIIVLIFRVISSRAPKFSMPKQSIGFVLGTPRNKTGPDLDDRAISWASECWPDVRQQRLSSADVPGRLEEDSLVVVLYSWFQDFQQFTRAECLRKVIGLAYLLNKKRCSVLVPLPDTFKVSNSFFAGLLVSLSDGNIVLAQNSQVSARAYGLEKCISPVMWHWPEDTTLAWSNSKPLSLRPKKVAFAVTGDPRRVELLEEWATTLERNGLQVWPSGHVERYSDYVRAARRLGVVVTTCYLQERFITGPFWYRWRLAPDTVTGRVWEAFAAKSLLICNDNSELRAFGFLPGQHFLDLPKRKSLASWELPTESVMQSIATKGHEHFCQLRNESVRAMEHLVQRG